jgi:hypothetical protein
MLEYVTLFFQRHKRLWVDPARAKKCSSASEPVSNASSSCRPEVVVTPDRFLSLEKINEYYVGKQKKIA